MPRIAYISSTFPNYQKCGTGIYAGYFTEALSEQGHDVHVITSAIPEIKPTHGKVTIHKIMESWSILELGKLIQLFQRIKPDIIHINHPTEIAGTKTKFLVNLLPEINRYTWKIPLVVTLHEFIHISWLGKIKVLPMLVQADAITVTNQKYRENLQKYLPKSHHRKIDVINIGSQFKFNLPDANKQEQRTRFDLKSEDQVIGFVGFITPPKGFHNLVESLAPLLRSNKNIKILALSSWNLSSALYRQEILDLIKKEGLSSQIIFTGFLNDEELWAALSAVDICAFPFDYPVENRSSGPLRQVIARGKPTIVFAESLEYSEFGFSHRKNIWFTPFKNLTTFRKDVEYLLSDTQLQSTLSAGALELSREFSFDHVGNAMSRLYSKLLSSKSLQLNQI